MPEFFVGDVVLAPLRFGFTGGVKTRPAVVIESCGNKIRLCPVTSRMPKDTAPVTLELDDFEKGGLSMFDESYILLYDIVELSKREIIGKKGRLTKEKTNFIVSAAAKR